jgi:cullin 3
MSSQKKKNFKIEPFKHKVEMDPRYAEKTWKILEDAIHEIYNHNASGLSFEELYRYSDVILICSELLGVCIVCPTLQS